MISNKHKKHFIWRILVIRALGKIKQQDECLEVKLGGTGYKFKSRIKKKVSFERNLKEGGS